MSENCPYRLHLRSTEQPHLENCRTFYDPATTEIEPTKHLSNTEESAFPDVKPFDRRPPIYPKAARVCGQLLVENESVHLRERFGEKEPPPRHITNRPLGVIRRSRHHIHAIGQQRNQELELMRVISAITID